MKTLLLVSLASLALATAVQAASAPKSSTSSSARTTTSSSSARSPAPAVRTSAPAARSSAPANYYYSQSTGQLSGGRGAGPILTQGYSGRGAGLNNPSAQAVRNTGPLPRGTYNATGVTTSKGPNTVVLQASSRAMLQGRDNNMRVHGDNPAANRTASEGCIIINPGVRSVMANQVKSGRPVQIHVGR